MQKILSTPYILLLSSHAENLLSVVHTIRAALPPLTLPLSATAVGSHALTWAQARRRVLPREVSRGSSEGSSDVGADRGTLISLPVTTLTIVRGCL